MPLRSRIETPFRILALDVDGTLLDPVGALRPRTVDAVARAARAGIRPVLCTGRRYRRALAIAQQLGLDAPLVCNSGALVKDPATHATLWRADFTAAILAQVLAVFRQHDEPIVTFTDRPLEDSDFLVEQAPAGRPLFDDYLTQNHSHACVDPAWSTRIDRDPHFHLCAIGTPAVMHAFHDALHAAIAGELRIFVQRVPRYAGTMCEILRGDASKWTAILHLAALWGIAPSEICAVGDDANDIPMLQGAGLGVAMGHASPAVLASADHITADHANDGVAQLIDDLLPP